MATHGKIDYVEFPARDIAATKAFFAKVFSWEYEDYGPDYVAIINAGIDGGFFKSDLVASSESGGALLVFFSDTLEQTQVDIEAAGGKVIKAIFAFPGGRRFHFIDPNGNEFAVWSDS